MACEDGCRSEEVIMTDRLKYEAMEERVRELEAELAGLRREGKEMSPAVTSGLYDILGALKEIASGNPEVTVDETSESDLVAEIKRCVNITAGNVSEIVQLSHEFAMGLAEYFDVLHKASEGDLSTRVRGSSDIELLEALKQMTNGMIESVSREMDNRKRAEEETQRQTEFLRLIIESLPHPFYVINASDYTVTMANSAAHKGTLPEKITCHQLTHKSNKPCESASHPCPLQAIRKTGKPVTVEHLHYDREGNPRHVEVHGYPILDADGNVSQVIESSLDITARKRAEEALKESERKYSTLVNNSPTGIYIDQGGKIVFANSRLAKIYGYPKEELVGIAARQLVHPEDRAFTDDIRRRRLNGEQAPSEYDARGLTKDGKTVWIKRRNARIEYLGRPAILGNVVDITERKHAEEALHASQEELTESEEKYRTLFDYDPNSIFLLELGTFSILDVNARALACYGYDKEELIGKSFFDLGTDDYQDGVLATRELLTSTLCSAYPKVQHQRKDGSGLYVDVYVCRTKYSRKYGIIATTVDVTESLVKETQLIQASKMATLGEMATGVAHELNQPLSVIKTASTFLKKKVDAKEGIKDDILKTMADEIDAHVDRASRIIKHMREFGRKSEVTREKVDVNEPLRKAVEIFSQQLTLRDIDVKLDLAEHLPPILADANRLEQVFINLLINARDAIEDRWKDKTPEKTDKCITLRTVLEGGQVRIEVGDTGTGIPKAIESKIFEPFFTTKKVGKGTGLGLSISYGIIQEYEGTIRAVSPRSGGTTFVMVFPVVGAKS